VAEEKLGSTAFGNEFLAGFYGTAIRKLINPYPANVENTVSS
jgi:hypothetical protein